MAQEFLGVFVDKVYKYQDWPVIQLYECIKQWSRIFEFINVSQCWSQSIFRSYQILCKSNRDVLVVLGNKFRLLCDLEDTAYQTFSNAES